MPDYGRTEIVCPHDDVIKNVFSKLWINSYIYIIIDRFVGQTYCSWFFIERSTGFLFRPRFLLAVWVQVQQSVQVFSSTYVSLKQNQSVLSSLFQPCWPKTCWNKTSQFYHRYFNPADQRPAETKPVSFIIVISTLLTKDLLKRRPIMNRKNYQSLSRYLTWN